MEGRNRRFLFRCLCAIAIIVHGNFTHNAYADTETINWYVDGETYDTTTCQSGDDIELPTTPTKKGYTFLGWSPYIPIEYLQSTGTQYIDTGLKNTDVDEFYVKFQSTYGQYKFIFGNYTNENTNTTRLLFTDTNDNSMFVNINNVANSPLRLTGFLPNSWNEVSAKKTGTTISATLNGSNANRTATSGATTTDNIVLFANALNGYKSGNIKISEIRFKLNNTLVRDFVPALDYNGIACMYDKVTETFFYNAGTGDFIAGPVISGE